VDSSIRYIGLKVVGLSRGPGFQVYSLGLAIWGRGFEVQDVEFNSRCRV
jgi:hypothetical protein